MQDFSTENNAETETVKTADPYEAITAVAEGKKVVFTYNKHYGCYVTFESDGKVTVADGDRPVYEHKMGNENSSMDADIANMRKAIDKVRKAKLAVPFGNVEEFGGMQEIARFIMNAYAVDGYIESYEQGVE